MRIVWPMRSANPVVVITIGRNYRPHWVWFFDGREYPDVLVDYSGDEQRAVLGTGFVLVVNPFAVYVMFPNWSRVVNMEGAHADRQTRPSPL